MIARDRMGVKPLYYARRDDLLVFASELKSLLASGLVTPELDGDAIRSYLALGYFAGPSTPLRGVFKLGPGHSLIVENENVRDERYWSFLSPRSRRSRSASGSTRTAWSRSSTRR